MRTENVVAICFSAQKIQDSPGNILCGNVTAFVLTKLVPSVYLCALQEQAICHLNSLGKSNNIKSNGRLFSIRLSKSAT